MGEKPKGVGLWVEVNGEWIQLGSVEGPSLISFVGGFPPAISIGYDLKPGELLPIVPKLKPDTAPIELTLKKFDANLPALKELSADQIFDSAKEFAKWTEEQITKALLYGGGDPNAPPPTGIMNATTAAKAWETPPLKSPADLYASIMGALPPYPPNGFAMKKTVLPCSCPSCLIAAGALEEPPPPTWRELAAAFEMTSGRNPIACPMPGLLVAAMVEHFGSTDPELRVRE